MIPHVLNKAFSALGLVVCAVLVKRTWGGSRFSMRRHDARAPPPVLRSYLMPVARVQKYHGDERVVE
jgi:hypothetical protein